MAGSTVAEKGRSTTRAGRGRPTRRWLQTAGVVAALGGLVACVPTTGGPSGPTVASHTVANTTDGSGRGTLTVDGCTMLTSTSVFTQRVDGLPTSVFGAGADPIARASSMLGSVGADSMKSGSSRAVYQGSVYGMPLVTVEGSKRDVTIGTSDYGYQTLPVFLPADGSIHWEGEPSLVFSDLHLTVLDRPSCTLQEHIGYNDAAKTTAHGVQWSLPIDSAAGPIRTDGHGSTAADAAGLPIAPLVYRFAEVYPSGPSGAVGSIDHALRIVFPKDVNSATASVWPARSTDGSATVPDAMRMGARLRLSAAALARLDADPSIPAGTRSILTALHRYGAVVADSTAPTAASGGFGLSGEYNPDWPAGVIESLSKVHAADFEVVDVACWQGTAQFNVKTPTPGAC